MVDKSNRNGARSQAQRSPSSGTEEGTEERTGVSAEFRVESSQQVLMCLQSPRPNPVPFGG